MGNTIGRQSYDPFLAALFLTGRVLDEFGIDIQSVLASLDKRGVPLEIKTLADKALFEISFKEALEEKIQERLRKERHLIEE